ncbi:helix-turn-helix domain-containing protein [Bradyrhizobium sp. 150]|nr:helix-turn-helix domain-containing protein [Bradyrhizobium sp. 150]
MTNKLLTTEQAAQELSVTAEQVRRYVADGELHPIDVARTGKTRQRLRFEVEDIEKFKERRKVKGASPCPPSGKTKARNTSRRTSGSTVVSFLAQQAAKRNARPKSALES